MLVVVFCIVRSAARKDKIEKGHAGIELPCFYCQNFGTNGRIGNSKQTVLLVICHLGAWHLLLLYVQHDTCRRGYYHN